MSGRVLCIGHRGARGLAPENTLAGFGKALEIGVDGVELDLQASKDNHLIVMHDYTVERTTNGRGKVKELTLAELKGLDASGWFGAEYAGERVPTLEEVIELVAGKALMLLEVKQAGVEEQVLEVLERHKLLDKSWILSFNFSSVQRAKELRPGLKVGLLTFRRQGVEKAVELGADVLAIAARVTDEALVEDAHHRGLEVFVWTVNEEAEMWRMIDIGVDAIASDFPDRLRGVVGG